MQLSIVLLVFLIVPLAWVFTVLLKERKRFHSLTPFIVGALFITIARLMDVPMEIPRLQLNSLFGFPKEYINALVVVVGASADIIGVTFLVLGFNETIKALTTSEKKITTLESLLPICAWCKRIRSEGGTWESIESYIEATSASSITHGVCPACAEKMLNDYRRKKS